MNAEEILGYYVPIPDGVKINYAGLENTLFPYCLLGGLAAGGVYHLGKLCSLALKMSAVSAPDGHFVTQ